MQKKKFLIGISATALFLVIFIAIASANGERVRNTPVVYWVSHTEYWSSSGPGSTERASTIVRITDYRGNPYQVQGCNVTILYPDKSVYVSNASMQQSAIPGNWYHEVPVPTIEGTYEQQVFCIYTGGTIATSQSFHVNPALNFIKTVDADVLATSAKLTDVNASLTALVQNSTADLRAQLSAAETNLSGLVSAVNNSISTQLTNAHGDLSTRLTNVSLTIQASIANANQTILARVQSAETNITNLLNSVHSQLRAELEAINATLDAKLTNVEASLSGQMNNVQSTIIARINASETSLTNLLTSLNNTVTEKLNAVDVHLNTTLLNVEYNLSAQLGNTRTAIQTQLTAANATLSQLITATSNDIESYLSAYLPSINQTTTNIYADTQWLITNAINHGAEANARFNSLDANLSLLENFCGNVQTTNSPLCQEIYGIRNNLTILRGESASYFISLNQTTTNIWDLLSGDISSSLSGLTATLATVKEQTTDINATVHDIRQEQLGEIRIDIIS